MVTIKSLRDAAKHERAAAEMARKDAQGLPMDDARRMQQKALDHTKAADRYEMEAAELEKEAVKIEEKMQTVQQKAQDDLTALEQQENHLRG